MWPPYYTAQRGMNPMGYPTQGLQIETSPEAKLSYYNLVDQVEKNEKEKKQNRTRLIVGAGLVFLAGYFLIRTLNKSSHE